MCVQIQLLFYGYVCSFLFCFNYFLCGFSCFFHVFLFCIIINYFLFVGLGTPLYAAHFRPGQYVDITAKT